MKEKPSVKGQLPLNLPDPGGYFGKYGGQFVPEMVRPALEELAEAYKQAGSDPGFTEEYDNYLKSYVGRPSPLTFAGRLTEAFHLMVEPPEGRIGFGCGI